LYFLLYFLFQTFSYASFPTLCLRFLNLSIFVLFLQYSKTLFIQHINNLLLSLKFTELEQNCYFYSFVK
jgi:hypothetical protein